ncbi:MAG: hypothetical protein QXL01_01370 [Thermoplasmatales archaeon]
METTVRLNVEPSNLYLQPEASAICYSMVLINKLRQERRAACARLVRELETEGQARIGSLVISVPGDGSLADRLHRIRDYAASQAVNYETMLVALSLAEAMNGDLRLIFDSKTGEVRSIGNGESIKGGHACWILRAANKMFGGQVLNPYDKADAVLWREAFTRGALNWAPLSLWTGAGTGRHILLVEGVVGDRVVFFDSYDGSKQYYRALFTSARSEGGNRWSVNIDELLNSGRIAYSITNEGKFVVKREFSERIFQSLEDFVLLDAIVRSFKYLEKKDELTRKT